MSTERTEIYAFGRNKFTYSQYSEFLTYTTSPCGHIPRLFPTLLLRLCLRTVASCTLKDWMLGVSTETESE